MAATKTEQLDLLSQQSWRPPEPTEPSEAAVLDALRGCSRPLTRAELVSRTGLSDRKVRRSIEMLRLACHPICPAGDKGYEYTWNREKVEHLVAEFRGLAMRHLKMHAQVKRLLSLAAS